MTEKKKTKEEKKADRIAEEGIHDFNKSMWILIGIFVVLLIGFLLFAFIRGGTTYDYKSPSGEIFQFRKTDIGGHTLHTLTIFVDQNKSLHQINLPMYYGPKQVKDVEFDTKIIEQINWYAKNKGWIFFTVDANDSNKIVIARNELSRLVGDSSFGVLKIPSYGAFTSNMSESNLTKDDVGYPFKTCKDAIGRQGVVWFRVGNQTRVYTDKCIIVEGTTYEEVIRAADRFAYELLGVM